jgi:hypothetical protein
VMCVVRRDRDALTDFEPTKPVSLRIEERV